VKKPNWCTATPAMDELPNPAPIVINKLDSARRQLITAIRIYFTNGDEVSTHTLTAAAFEILDDLDKHGANTGSIFDHAEQYIKPEYVEEFRKLRPRAQNFFKHADRDPEDSFTFYPSYRGTALGGNREVL